MRGRGMGGRGQGAAAVRLRCHRLPDSSALKADSEAGCARSILCFHRFRAFKKSPCDTGPRPQAAFLRPERGGAWSGAPAGAFRTPPHRSRTASALTCCTCGVNPAPRARVCGCPASVAVALAETVVAGPERAGMDSTGPPPESCQGRRGKSEPQGNEPYLGVFRLLRGVAPSAQAGLGGGQAWAVVSPRCPTVRAGGGAGGRGRHLPGWPWALGPGVQRKPADFL